MGKVCFLIRVISHNISDVHSSRDLNEARKHARGILEEAVPQTGEWEKQRLWSVSVLGMFAGNSKEARGLELILSRGGSSRELGQRGSQRTLYPERSEKWKLFNYIFLFSERKKKQPFIILRCLP